MVTAPSVRWILVELDYIIARVIHGNMYVSDGYVHSRVAS